MTTPSPNYRITFWVIALLGLLADQGTKYGVFHWLEAGNNWIQVAGVSQHGFELVPRVFSLIPQEELNKGALFGLGNHPEHGDKANLIFLGVSALAVCLIAGWSFRSTFASDRTLCVALGLIMAGAMGNLYDRVTFGGVRDFLWVYYENADHVLRFNYPVFNVADTLLVVGAGLLLLTTFLAKPAQTPARQPSTTTSVA